MSTATICASRHIGTCKAHGAACPTCKARRKFSFRIPDESVCPDALLALCDPPDVPPRCASAVGRLQRPTPRAGLVEPVRFAEPVRRALLAARAPVGTVTRRWVDDWRALALVLARRAPSGEQNLPATRCARAVRRGDAPVTLAFDLARRHAAESDAQRLSQPRSPGGARRRHRRRQPPSLRRRRHAALLFGPRAGSSDAAGARAELVRRWRLPELRAFPTGAPRGRRRAARRRAPRRRRRGPRRRASPGAPRERRAARRRGSARARRRRRRRARRGAGAARPWFQPTTSGSACSRAPRMAALTSPRSSGGSAARGGAPPPSRASTSTCAPSWRRRPTCTRRCSSSSERERSGHRTSEYGLLNQEHCTAPHLIAPADGQPRRAAPPGAPSAHVFRRRSAPRASLTPASRRDSSRTTRAARRGRGCAR